MNAKEIADLARSTNLADETARVALDDAIGARITERRDAGESVAMERALRACANEAHDAVRCLSRDLASWGHDFVALAERLSGGGQIERWESEVIKAPVHSAGGYMARIAAWESMIDLFESVADLVRATQEEKAEALARRAADKAAIVAAPKAKNRKKAA